MEQRFDFSQIEKNAHIHFIGIGGISMSGLAQLMLERGYDVSGSDWNKSDVTAHLESLGAHIYYGRDKSDFIDTADLVVHTAAAHDDNPEMVRAAQLGIRNIDRAEFLGAVMLGYSMAAGIAGTHGKTTVTSMTAHALIYADTDPTVSVGGMLDLIGGNFRTGKSDVFVTEACEYTNSFLKFFPKIAVITNIEEDHLDFFSGLEEIEESFGKFADLTSMHEGGAVIAKNDDENIKAALANTSANVIYYDTKPTASDGTKSDFYAANIQLLPEKSSFDVKNADGDTVCSMNVQVPGMHNVLNALAALCVCMKMGVAPEIAAKGIETFGGTHRRFEHKGTFRGAQVIDDYAHHPTEIRATLEAASQLGANRVWCIFQPHTYTRTRTLWDEFVKCFTKADTLILADIYPAREVFDGVTRSSDLAAEIAKSGLDARYAPSFDAIKGILRNEVRAGDVVLTMGAGDVYKIGEELVSEEE